MPLDPSIALQYQPFKVEPQANALARILQLQTLQQQNALGKLDLQEKQATLGERNALRDYLGNATNNLDTPEGQAGLYKVAPTQAPGILKGRLELKSTQSTIDKNAAETDASRFRTAHAKAVAMADLIGSATDQASYDAAKARGVAMGLTPDPAAPAQFDPRYVAASQQQALTTVQRIEQMARQRGLDLTQRGQDLADKRAAQSDATARRGQDMTDARTRESTAAAMTKPFEITGPDGKPILVQQDRQGNIIPVPGYAPKTGADKPMTDAQAKAALFGSRMEAANKILETLAADGTDTSVPGSRAGYGIGAVVNAMSPAKQQQLDQAKRDFINATLRRESGAVISDAEFDNGDKQYFPQVGDSKEVKAQKAQNRAIAVRGVQAEVPKGNRGVLDEIQGKQATSFGDPEKERRYQEWKAKQGAR